MIWRRCSTAARRPQSNWSWANLRPRRRRGGRWTCAACAWNACGSLGASTWGLALWRRLGLHTLLRELLPAGEEDVGWDLTACVLTLGRFGAQGSELAVAERW